MVTLQIYVLVVAALFQLCHVRADYDCICNYKVETSVYSSPSDQNNPLGTMYELDCKPIHGPIVNGFSEIAYEHKIAYVKVEQDVTKQVCPGDIPDTDKVTTTAAPVTTSTTTFVKMTATTATSIASPSTTVTTTTYTVSTTKILPTTSTSSTITVTANPKSTTTTTTSSTTPVPTTKTETTTTAIITKPITQTTVSNTQVPVMTTTPKQIISTTRQDLTSAKTTPVATSTASTVTSRLITSTETAAPATCPIAVAGSMYNWKTTVYGGSCYEVVAHSRSFNDAETDCRHRGGHLMDIQSAAEQEFITKYLQANYNHEVWIGLGDHTHEETWTWISGVPLRYTHWQPGRKDFFIHGLEDCVVLEPSNHGYWDDRQCGGFLAAKHSYVCQYDVRSPVIVG